MVNSKYLLRKRIINDLHVKGERTIHMDIKVISDRSQQLNSNSLILEHDNWNDYGYYDLYNVSYVPVNQEEKPIYIGDYRIRSRMENGELDLEKGQFISLGCSIKFYDNLYKTLKQNEYDLEDMEQILLNLNDLLVVDSDIISIDSVITLDETTLKITKKDSKIEFPEIDKTLFRDKQDDIYYLNVLLKKYQHNLFDFFDLNSFKEILNSLHQDETFLNNFVKYIINADTDIIKPLVELIVSFNESNRDSEEVSKIILKRIRSRFQLDQELNERINKILNSHTRIMELVKDIRGLLKVKEEEIEQVIIGHYTSLNTIHYLIKNKKEDPKIPYMRLTNINQMNDPLEGKVVFNFLNQESTHNTQNYVSCATIAKDSLPMWNLYAENATGVFLVYNKEYLKNIINNQSINLFHVCYFNYENIDNTICVPSSKDSEALAKKVNKKLKKLQEEIDSSSSSDNNLFQTIEDMSFLFKNIEYSYEKELRFHINSPKEIELETNGSFPFPFLYTYFKEELKYDKIILGPKSTIARDFISPYIGYISDNKVEVEESQTHIR